jgi:broad specificity phosphatase PhoE
MESDSDLVIVFETHATSVDNEAGLASGWFDVGLSARGEEQARALGSRRRFDDLAAVFCSDLSRARRTAEIAFGDRRLAIVPDARLRECDYGALTRGPALEIEARRAEYVLTPFPGGESYQQVVERVSTWLTDALFRFAGKSVLVIGHRATFYALEHVVRNVPLPEAVVAPWQWQPGWIYRVTRNSERIDRNAGPTS